MDSHLQKKLMDQSFRFSRLMGRIYHFYHKQGEKPLLHPGQGRLLFQILENEPVGQKDLAFLLDIRPSSLSELLKKLEDKGLVARTPDDRDKRNMIVTLTEQGKELVQQTTQGREALDETIFGALSEDERKQFSFLLGKLTDSWQSVLAEAGEPEEPLGRGPHCGPRGGSPEHGPHHGPCPEMDPRFRRHHKGAWDERFRNWGRCE